MLMDLQSGRVLVSVSADEAGSRRSTAVQAEVSEARLLAELRNSVTVELAEVLGTEIQSRGAANGG